MHSLEDALYIAHGVTAETARRLTAWDAAVAAEPPHAPGRWHMRFQRYMRSVAVSASTRIEGNPMSPPQVDALLSGDPVSAPVQRQLENLNYNRALDLATALALTDSYEWQESIFSAINSTILQSLPDDRQGRYREEPLRVAGFYDPPHHSQLVPLMREFIRWLRESGEHPLVRVALLHLNAVAIHPFLDGNGRTARIASTLELMRSGVRAPELLTVESYLAAHRDEYFERLRTTLGPTYQPSRHSATEWVDYYVRVSTALLDMENRIEEAWPHDLGLLTEILARRDEPWDWAPVLHMAAYAPLRSRDVAEYFERSLSWSRALLGRIVRAGWLRQEGRTRASHWLAEPRLRELDLRVPDLLRRLEQGETLGLEDA
jgi:hypothetical protein